MKIMNKEYKKLLLSTLRNNEYQQTQTRLRNNNKFCCLGVLCDVVLKHNRDKNIKFYWRGNYFYGEVNENNIKSYDKEGYLLPNVIIDITELNTSLSQLNDLGVSFEDIANLIEKYF